MLLIISIVISSVSSLSAKEGKFNFKHLDKQKWQSLETEHYKIYANFNAKGLNETGLQLEKFRAFSRLFLDSKVVSNRAKTKTRLFLTKSDKTWKSLGLDQDLVFTYKITPREGTIIFARTQGFFGTRSLRKPHQGRAILLTAIASEMLTSEGLQGELPNWFLTGFSYYLATYREPKDQIMLGDPSAHENRLFGLTNDFGNLHKLNMQEVFAPEYSEYSEDEKIKSRRRRLHASNSYYMRSFVAVHYFFADLERRKKMYQYLAKVEKGEDYQAAFVDSFGYDFDEFDSRTRKYITGRTMMARVYQQDAVNPLLKLSGQAQADELTAKEFFKRLVPTFSLMGDKTFGASAKKEFLSKVEEKYGKLFEQPDWLKE